MLWLRLKPCGEVTSLNSETKPPSPTHTHLAVEETRVLVAAVVAAVRFFFFIFIALRS